MSDFEHILIAEDDRDIQDIVDYNLRQEGFSTTLINRGDKVLEAIKTKKPDLLVLDLMLPGESGLEVCKKIRADESYRRIPVIMLTAKGSETDKIVGLELGADDYMSKPFSTKELVARVKAQLRRNKMAPTSKDLLKSGELSIDLKSYKVMIGSSDVSLTLTEFKILKELMENKGRVLSRQNLVTTVMGSDVSVTDRTIDVHLASLRKKIGEYADHIETVRGVGYRFRE